jgi:hypothetical protein
MLKRLSLQADPQIIHPGPIRLQHFSRLMYLIQREQLIAVHRSPGVHATLQRA